MHRLYRVAALAVFLSLLLAAPAMAQTPFPDTIPLPNGFAPEGIAKGRGPTMYTGSLSGQGIYSFNVRTGDGEFLVEDVDGQNFTGLKFDARSGYLFAAGHASGRALVYDTDTGEEVAAFDLSALLPGTSPGSTVPPAGTVPPPPTQWFINDVVVTRDAAYFTDSRNPWLYVLPLGRNGRLAGDPELLLYSGDWVQGEGFGANGIDATPNGRTLVVVNSGSGTLYNVDPETGLTTEIDLGDESVPNGDGILLSGLTLYVVQNRLNQIAVVRLTPDFTTGSIVDLLTNDNFDVPTTIAHFGRALYAVNARFGIEVTPETEFDAVRVEK